MTTPMLPLDDALLEAGSLAFACIVPWFIADHEGTVLESWLGPILQNPPIARQMDPGAASGPPARQRPDRRHTDRQRIVAAHRVGDTRAMIATTLTRAAVAVAVLVSSAGSLDAQQPRLGVTAGLGVATQYPDRFQEGCGNPAGAAPFVQAHHRIHRLVSAELGLSAQIQIPPGAYCTADLVPLMDGDVIRDFRSSTGSVSVAGEARVVLTPVAGEDGMFRVIGGGAWYLARSSPAWIAGLGYRRSSSRGAWVVDVEQWNVGVAYDLERFRTGGAREPLGEGREWQRFWQIRVGLTLWSS